MVGAKGEAFRLAGGFRAALRGPQVEAAHPQAHSALAELSDGPYFDLAGWLDEASLCSTDATCRRLLQLNSAHIGPWREMGKRAFHGLELHDEGLFEPSQPSRKFTAIFWKARYKRFQESLSTFMDPFCGREINHVEQPDEVAYVKCHLCTDLLSQDLKSTTGVYLEVEVEDNPDNLSMAVVDFEAGGCSSVTFSPDTGAVIRERKVRESPRKVEGAYIQPLPALTQGERFSGCLGLYLQNGKLAFFRRSCSRPEWSSERDGPLEGTTGGRPKPGSEIWESTGFVSDLSWASGSRLTPCLAFRREGKYVVRIASLKDAPPMPIEAFDTTHSESAWNALDWEAEEADNDTEMEDAASVSMAQR
jgi:hypothetical protein